MTTKTIIVEKMVMVIKNLMVEENAAKKRVEKDAKHAAKKRVKNEEAMEMICRE